MKLITTIFAAGLALFSPYLLAEEIWVNVASVKQGTFVGETTRKGFENKVQALAFSHEIMTPRDTATGQVLGKRQHKPIIITKRVGASSPQFFSALATNEVLKNVTIDFLVANAKTGQLILVYQIVLQNASISRISQRLATDAAMSGSMSDRYVEEISFAYQSITVNYPPLKGSASDNWQ